MWQEKKITFLDDIWRISRHLWTTTKETITKVLIHTKIRPLPDIPLSLPDFCLTSDTPTTLNLVPLHIIPEEDTVDVYPLPHMPKIKTKRIRFASENIQYTFMGFLEREIQRKKSKCTIDNEASRWNREWQYFYHNLYF